MVNEQWESDGTTQERQLRDQRVGNEEKRLSSKRSITVRRKLQATNVRRSKRRSHCKLVYARISTERIKDSSPGSSPSLHHPPHPSIHHTQAPATNNYQQQPHQPASTSTTHHHTVSIGAPFNQTHSTSHRHTPSAASTPHHGPPHHTRHPDKP